MRLQRHQNRKGKEMDKEIKKKVRKDLLKAYAMYPAEVDIHYKGKNTIDSILTTYPSDEVVCRLETSLKERVYFKAIVVVNIGFDMEIADLVRRMNKQRLFEKVSLDCYPDAVVLGFEIWKGYKEFESFEDVTGIVRSVICEARAVKKEMGRIVAMKEFIAAKNRPATLYGPPEVLEKIALENDNQGKT